MPPPDAILYQISNFSAQWKYLYFAVYSSTRRHRVVLTELSRSRKTPARETVRKMIEIIRLADTARVQKKK